MKNLNQLQFALDKQAPTISSVSSLHGEIQLSLEMKQKLGQALVRIITDEMKHRHQALLDFIDDEIALLESDAVHWHDPCHQESE